MRFSWTIKELRLLRALLQDAEYHNADLQEVMEENGDDDSDRFREAKARQESADVIGSKVLKEILRREGQSRHLRRRKAVR